MGEHVAGDDAALVHRPQRKRPLQISHREPAVRAVEEIERASQAAPKGEHARHGQEADDRHHEHDGCVFDTVTQRGSLISHQG